MRAKNSDLFVSLSIAFLNAILLLLPFTILWVGILLALPMVFFVPGYLLTEILTHSRRLDIAYRLTLSLGLSLTLDILGGFLLNVLPVGLRTQSWVALLCCLALLFALAVFFLRKSILYESLRDEHGNRLSSAKPVFWRRVRGGIVFALAAALVVLSLVYATQGVAKEPQPGFTQLWMLPSRQPSCAVNIGIRSFEKDSITYHAVMTVNSIKTMAWSSLVLAPDQTWERSIAVKLATTKDMFVELKLYRDDKPTVVYREVHLTLTVASTGQKTLYCHV